MKTHPPYLLLMFIVIGLTATSCREISSSLFPAEEPGLRGSGVVEAVEITVSSELSGRVASIAVAEGDPVAEGDLLFQLDGDDVKNQLQQARARLASAQAGLRNAEAALAAAQAGRTEAEAAVELAEINYQQSLAHSLLSDSESSPHALAESSPTAFALPGWYFTSSEKIQAAEAVVQEAREEVDETQDELNQLLAEIDSAKLQEAEQQLAKARAAFSIAADLLDQEAARDPDQEVSSYIRERYDAAEKNLQEAQDDYYSLLTDAQAESVRTTRAHLSANGERQQLAESYLAALHRGPYAYPVLAARASLAQTRASLDRVDAQIAQAKTAREVARQAVAQAEASLAAVQLQEEKLTVQAPAPGVILVRNLDAGEVIQAGAPSLIIGQLDELTVTVYLPETVYGRVSLGDRARLTTDSFPNQEFSAEVTRIADQAEYTPRNVQTEEERQKTVYAVELKIFDPEDKLKPGMPTEVIFEPGE